MKKYNTFADTGDTAHSRDGAPGGTIAFSFNVDDDYALTQDDLAAGFKLATDEEFEEINRQSIQQYDEWDRTAGPYVITDFFNRLTPVQVATIRSISQSDPSVDYLWNKLLSLREGIDGPPDGKTQGRAESMAAKAACTAIFGAQEADRLFARP